MSSFSLIAVYVKIVKIGTANLLGTGNVNSTSDVMLGNRLYTFTFIEFEKTEKHKFKHSKLVFKGSSTQMGNFLSARVMKPDQKVEDAEMTGKSQWHTSQFID